MRPQDMRTQLLLPFRATPAIELWGGIECTLNRVQDQYLDQFKWSGHYQRPQDLDAIASLGIKTLRYPVSWERIAPHHPDEMDWAWTDARMSRLRELGITLIVGLTHHGSGPRYTDLLDPEFPEKLARFARAVAERYPWAEYFTPVNEPLTTARFAALYGHWYPHCNDDLSFIRALIHQCRAVALAMREIRKSIPQAKLVQTEDMGKVYSTAKLAYQAEFENERRWLSFDLLCGKVHGDQRMAHHLRWLNIPEQKYSDLNENPCPPEVMGINYYLTSERFLDERVASYPSCTHGGNGRDRYADVAAVRVTAGGIAGVGGMLGEAWQRYGLPLAITEAHLGCTREEQVRWLYEVWNEAHGARRAGVDVQAVTVWSLLGAHNWNTLVTRDEDCYEPGVFDLRGGELHETALAQLTRDLATGNEPRHPILATPGWWRQASRLDHPTCHAAQDKASLNFGKRLAAIRNPTTRTMNSSRHRRKTQPLLITGATGTLGQAFARLCQARNIEHQLFDRNQMEIADPVEVTAAIDCWKPWAIINTAGYVRVDDAEHEAKRCFRENTTGPSVLSGACAQHGVKLMSFSSDLVFDGTKSTPYVESDATHALNVYGRSKADAENYVIESNPNALMIRTSAFFGPWDEYNFATVLLSVVAEGNEFHAANDCTISPTYIPDLVNLCLDLLIDGQCGLWHVANKGEVTWHEFAQRIVAAAHADVGMLVGRPSSELGWLAARPKYCALTTERSLRLPPLNDAIARYVESRAQHLNEMQRLLDVEELESRQAQAVGS